MKLPVCCVVRWGRNGFGSKPDNEEGIPERNHHPNHPIAQWLAPATVPGQ
jgi:hypothetical protein